MNNFCMDTQQFTNILHRGGAQRFTQDLTAGPNGDKTVTLWSSTAELLKVPPATGRENLYYSVNPTTVRVTDKDRAKYVGKTDSYIERYVASKNETVAALNCLYADIDAKDFTAPTNAEVEAQYQTLRNDPDKEKSKEKALRNEALGRAKSAKYKTDPAKYLALVADHVAQMTPAPSVIVASGGGYQCFWLFAETFYLRSDDDRKRAIALQKRWVYFVGGDPGVCDIRRVLRLPGGINHKKAYAPNFPLVTFVKQEFDLRYDLTALESLLPTPVAQPAKKHATTATRTHQDGATATTATNSTPYEGDSVIKAYNAKYTITALLEANGYTRHGDRYLRPGGTDSPGVEIDTATNRSRHWSSNDQLYDTHWRRPFDVFCTFTHNGNVRAAVAAAAVELGMVRPPINVTATLDTLRLWIKTRNLAPLLPAGKGSKKVRLVVDAIFDLMEANQRFVVTTGKKRLAGGAGVSANTVKNVLALVNEHIFDVTPTEYGDRITLVSNCRLMKFDPLLDVVKECLTTGGQKTQNDKNAYSPHKTDDAFATGMSRYMRDRMSALAQTLDITYPQAKADYTFGGLGESVLLAYDTFLRVGEMTAREYAEETGLKLGVARTHLHRAEKMGLAESEREGSRGPKVYTFIPEFWEKVAELEPNLRTYRLSDQRESKRIESAQQWCVKGIDEAKAAQATEQAHRLDRRFAKLAKERVPHLERLHPELSPDDIERLAYDVAAYKRSPKSEQGITTKRNEARAEHRDDVTMIRELAESFSDIDTPKEYVFNEIMKYGIFDARLVRDVLQSPRQMANYETLDEIRQRAWVAS